MKLLRNKINPADRYAPADFFVRERINMDYSKLTKDAFDAIVTGELAHLTIWLEGEINNIISDYFIGKSSRRDDFERLFLYRDGLTFQDKIDILRAMFPLLGELISKLELKKLINEVEDFKKYRNAMAHGLSVANDKTLVLNIEIVSRSGKPKVITITPESHEKFYKKGELLLNKLKQVRKKILLEMGIMRQVHKKN
jgi:hypothetical protein